MTTRPTSSKIEDADPSLIKGSHMPSNIPGDVKSLREMKPQGKRGTFLSQELYQKIWGEVCDWYDKNIEIWVRNIHKAYDLTGDCGYSCLTQNWDFRSQHCKLTFSDDDIRNNIIEKIYCPMNWLYVRDNYGQNPMRYSEGFTGLMVTFRITVEQVQQPDEYAWSYSYGLSLEMSCGEHGAILSR